LENIMRESEMRQRIEGFLKRRMQGMLAPALGLGLALGGCGGTEYMAQFPLEDAGGGHHDGVGLSHDTPVYSAPLTSDVAAADTLAGKDTSLVAEDGALDLLTTLDTNALAEVAPTDVAPPIIDTVKDSAAEAAASSEAHSGMDAGTDVDAGVDLGNVTTKYLAQLPDAGRDFGVAPLYMASLPLG
jgi:hypothetical protein